MARLRAVLFDLDGVLVRILSEPSGPEGTLHVRVDPDAAGVLAALRRAGCGIAVVSNASGSVAREALEQAELAADAVFGADDVARPKPAPDMVLRALEVLRVGAADALMVGDGGGDRAAARSAGVRFAGLGISGDVTLRALSEVLALVLEVEGGTR